jgi:hypothetical protein
MTLIICESYNTLKLITSNVIMEVVKRFLQPPQRQELPEMPLVFLAGPIQGAPNWQSVLGKQLLVHNKNVLVASPRRAGVDKKDFVYAEQKAWELDHLRRATKFGVAAFWFAAQDPELPYEAGRAYAQTSRIEIGKVLGWKDFEPQIQVVVGFDPNYAANGGGSEKYIRDECRQYDIPVQTSVNAMQSAIVSAL